jgi:anaerobic ribonucleoside-triphosphate reductase activating protein
MKIIINSIDYYGSIVDGPGIRTVVYLQGCEQKCLGCHNPNTWDISKGTPRDITNIVEELRDRVFNKKLTISGGEPLMQYQAVLELIKSLHDFDIALYTGFELDEVPKDLLEHLHYIKVGCYIQENSCTTSPFIGSTNQKFIDLSGGCPDEGDTVR